MYGASRGSGTIRVLCALGSWWLVVGSALGVPDPPELNTAEGLPGRGEKKFGDGCKDDLECGFDGAYCDPKKRNCICRPEFDVTNHIDKCGYFSTINESCFFNEQCPEHGRETVCRDNRCQCRFDKTPMLQPNGNIECIVEAPPPEVNYVDPAMIGVLVGMALMFIIICVVLRLFSKARWRENRTIFNTPNPRLMNVSLLRDSKLLHGQERRGSRASVRGPSRQPSMASLRPHSPSASQGSRTGSRRGSRGSSGNASATSTRSNKSSAPANNVAADSVLENVTVEILDSKK